MPRRLPSLLALTCALSLLAPAAAGATPVATGTATGTIIALGPSTVTLQAPGRQSAAIDTMIAAATAIARRHYPYVYAGGHAEAGIASVGMKGPGYTGHTRGFDCSGSVAAVLAAGGLWPARGGVPSDAGMISELESWHLIAPGAGTAPNDVTLYDDWGVHIFMSINGRFFGTSDGGGGDPSGGPQWIDDGAPFAHGHVYRRYHVISSVLARVTRPGRALTMTVSDPVGGLAAGERVRVAYREDRTGTLVATAITFPDSASATGTVTSLGASGKLFTVQPATGAPETFATGADPALLAGVAAGDTVSVSYTRSGPALLAHAVTVTATPAPAPAGTGTSSQ
jgi:hypothetical protein